MEDTSETLASRREYARLYYHQNKERLRARREERKERVKEVRKQEYQRNKDRIKKRNEAYRVRNKDKRNERERRKRAEDPAFASAEKARHVRRYTTCRRYRIRVLTTNAKLRGKMSGMPADPACFEAILESPPSTCACCGAELDYQNRRTPLSPSVDRINNELSYVIGNVAVICFRCNSLKKDGSIEDFERILSYMRNSLPPV